MSPQAVRELVGVLRNAFASSVTLAEPALVRKQVKLPLSVVK